MRIINLRESVIEILSNLDIFSDLPEEEITLLSKAAKIKSIGKNSFIYQPGDPTDKIFFVLEGVIKTGTYNIEGKEAIKHVIYSGEMFGELGLSGIQERSDFAGTLKKEAEVVSIPTVAIRETISRNPALGLTLISKLGARIQQSEKRLEGLIFNDSRSRIISFIKSQAKKVGQSYGDEILIKHDLTQQDMANITGTSRQLVTIVLNELRKENMINFDRSSILVRNIKALV